MPKKYDEQTRAKAVRLVQEHRDDFGSEYEAIKAIAGRLGMNPETVRKWLRQAEVEAGQRLDGRPQIPGHQEGQSGAFAVHRQRKEPRIHLNDPPVL